ncbi:HEPN/Toprim-associated domain-containing protein [Variovorax sp. Root434]|uniref:HEPN/Toprim-associated domain-containing protein n=1 Tax=Variovorax sp. Root434 TaxID=1736536 RepID=UPI0009EB69BC|nr:HEPN/Toprim-associated domain-containing protein [Variovorax sp. Root434]
MGTEIYLKVGGVTLDWSKNSRGAPHGILFQKKDRIRRRSDQVNYEYCEENEIDVEPSERALVRSLKEVIPRLNLLGFTREQAATEYDLWVREETAYADGEASNPNFLSFQEFIDFLGRHPIAALDNTYIQHGSESRSQVSARFDADEAIHRIPPSESSGYGYSETSYFESLVGRLHPYSLLSALALVPENLDQDVVWHYGPMVHSGWAVEEDFAPGASRRETFLIATEGSSDVHILKHAFALLMPEIEDFFSFIDVSERHPFSGTGSLVRFAEGLAKIDVHNNVLFIFDNDAEGWDALDQIRRFTLPANMRAMALPELDEFLSFPAFGPQGTMTADINKKAAAIECYLDLRTTHLTPARIIWTNFKKERNDYQGSLEFKETYMRTFMGQTKESLSSGAYDFTKIAKVLNCILAECALIRAEIHEC